MTLYTYSTHILMSRSATGDLEQSELIWTIIPTLGTRFGQPLFPLCVLSHGADFENQSTHRRDIEGYLEQVATRTEFADNTNVQWFDVNLQGYAVESKLFTIH